jgi:hypothetical protein
MRLAPVFVSMLFCTIQAHAASAAPATTGCVRHWKFEEGRGDSALESASKTKHRILGTASWAAGQNGSALVFNGKDTVVNIGKIIPISDPAYTFSIWIKATEGSRYQTIVARDRCFVSPYEWRLYLTGGRLGFYEKDGAERNGNLEPFETQATVPLNQWVHVALTRDNCDYTLYIQGTVAASKHSTMEGSPDFLISQPENPVDMLIGSRWQANGKTVRAEECFAGALDDFQFYNKALSAQEISALAAAAAGGK